jgi:microcin C transport system substrate-binding protein
LVWARALDQIGITARVQMVDSAAYQARISTFDFDVIIYKWINTLSPGNEQSVYWSSVAADQKGSRNYAGVHDSVVDALANAIPATATREDLVATAHALDRVLMAGHYTIPFYYLGADDYVFWTAHLRYPTTPPLYGTVLESWWSDEKSPK